MKAFVEQLIEQQQKSYKSDYHLMVADYNREKETVKGYNGRQLLELLQNCDDEGSVEVAITLDTEKKLISISNNGNPFSESGYRSLFISNLSSKRSRRQYIGSKGLGFRSIINWSDSIEIQSNGISLLYSDRNKIETFDKLFSPEKKTEIRIENGLNETAVPVPFLTMPIVKEFKQSPYVTTIVINYRQEYLADIIEQVNKITPETLLFLRSIEHVKFEGFKGKKHIDCLKEVINIEAQHFCPSQQAVYEGSSWLIFNDEALLPEELADKESEEREFYQIKIAIEESFKSSTPYLYSFFPTNIRLGQPYILHATFDLDSTRNQLNNSDKNKFILNRAVEFTLRVAKYFTQDKVDYRPLQILQHSHKADTLNSLGYYELLENAMRTESVYPCVDNTYKSLNKVLFVSDQFASMLIRTRSTDVFNFHLLPIPPNDKISLNLSLKRSLAEVIGAVALLNKIGQSNLSVGERGFLIEEVVKNYSQIRTSNKNGMNFLVNTDDEIIPGKEYIYTPITDDLQLNIPSFTKIHFLKRELYDELVSVFGYTVNRNPNKSRFVYDQLTGFCNIHSYEPATLAQKIISAAANKINDDKGSAVAIIKEMNECLFKNFKQIDTTSRKTPLGVKVPAITIDGNIKPLDETVLSDFYPTGKLTAQIFEGIYSDAHFVASPIILGITGDEDIQEIEDYLLWLGVNKFARYVEENSSLFSNYSAFIKQVKNISNSTGHQITFLRILNFEEILNKITPNRLILWIHSDPVLRIQMSDANNTDVFRNSYRGLFTVSHKPSYLKYILQTRYSYKFDELLIDERYTLFNTFNIDYRAEEFVKNGISKSSINEILSSLGAKDDFNAISIQKVAYILNELPSKFPDGRKTQSFYKRALAHYVANRKEIKSPLKLFALSDGKGLCVYNQEQIYFSDKIKLPKRLRKNFPILNFPARAGGAEAISFFGINSLDGIEIKVISHNISEELSQQFKSNFERLKPLILTHRFNDIQDAKQRKFQANICNKINVVLCTEFMYRANGHDYEALDYEFLNHEDTFYLKVNALDTIEELNKNFTFNEAISDIIAQSFDITSENNEFNLLLTYGYEEGLKHTKENYGEDTYQEALELLGLADFKNAFWHATLTAIGLNYESKHDDIELESYLKEKLGLELDINSINYDLLNERTEMEKVERVFTHFNIDLETFVKIYPYKIGMADIHRGALRDKILSSKQLVKSSIWKRLLNTNIESQARLLSEINKFENCEEFIAKKANQLNYSFKIETEELLMEFINSLYGELEMIEDAQVEVVRKGNSEKFNSEQLDLISQDESLKSLIHFPDAISYIKSKINVSSSIGNAPFYGEDDGSGLETEVALEPSLVDSSILMAIDSPPGNNNQKGVYTPKHADGKSLKRRGNKSESIVYEFMVKNKYINVYHASQDNEGLHYDIRYVDLNGRVKYVEVKTFDYGSFIMSKNEYEFGLKNKGDYEIWLVHNQDKIIAIKDFFTNKKYSVSIKDYIVHLQIP